MLEPQVQTAALSALDSVHRAAPGLLHGDIRLHNLMLLDMDSDAEQWDSEAEGGSEAEGDSEAEDGEPEGIMNALGSAALDSVLGADPAAGSGASAAGASAAGMSPAASGQPAAPVQGAGLCQQQQPQCKVMVIDFGRARLHAGGARQRQRAERAELERLLQACSRSA
jgi:hypothetical protein